VAGLNENTALMKIRGNWWKMLGAALVLYAIVGGMLAPLKPGIVQATPGNARAGQTLELAVRGYNTFYTRGADNLRAWLKLDEAGALAASDIAVEDDRHLRLVFQLPEYLPVGERVADLALIIDNGHDGASVLPSAVFVTQDSIDPALGRQVWPDDQIGGLHTRKGIAFPFRNILSETIRNTYFHVPLWFGMVFLFLAAVVGSVRYLRRFDPAEDRRAAALTQVGILFGLLGLLTGAIWAKNTWGAYWSWDIKQNMTAAALLIYCAYFVLRNAFDDPERKARLSAVYSIFAFAALIPLIYVIPRMTDSLHPGAGGNPAFGTEDLDNTMRLFFYPAVIGWTLLGFWIADLLRRVNALRDHLEESAENI
jgi:heme exporter protein C